MHTKQITVAVNWLDEVDGKTVADAIAYLQTLNQSHTLTYSMEGDTHGCNVESSLYYDEPMTNAEIVADLEKYYAKRIRHFQDAKCYYLKQGMFSRMDNCAKQIAQLREQLAIAKNKYGA